MRKGSDTFTTFAAATTCVGAVGLIAGAFGGWTAGLLCAAFVASLVGSGWLLWSSRPANPEAVRPCPRCSYDLGAMSIPAKCPECGGHITDEMQMRRRRRSWRRIAAAVALPLAVPAVVVGRVASAEIENGTIVDRLPDSVVLWVLPYATDEMWLRAERKLANGPVSPARSSRTADLMIAGLASGAVRNHAIFARSSVLWRTLEKDDQVRVVSARLTADGATALQMVVWLDEEQFKVLIPQVRAVVADPKVDGIFAHMARERLDAQ